MPFKDIDNYGLIGDCRSAALVSSEGSIDWCCLPRFDSPSIFAKVLDDERGGFFRVWATAESRFKQMYLPESNVLMTRFLSPDGVGEVIDFMPWYKGESGMQGLVRIARCVRGSVNFRLQCVPGFDYARERHQLTLNGTQAVFGGKELKLVLRSEVPLEECECGGVAAEFQLKEKEKRGFVLEVNGDETSPLSPDLEKFTWDLMFQNLGYWREWAGHCTYTGRWREMVMRSALVLKLLMYDPTGAIIASPTCSLPEEIGGIRNWDYRYVWIRDAAFSVYALLRLGYYDEATRFMEWLHKRAQDKQEVGPLQVMYRVDGSSDLTEFTLDHLSGYRCSSPVRVGNCASEQLQLDIYGELIDSIYLFNKYVEPVSYDFWSHLREIAYWICDNWQRPDHSIWEGRNGPEQYTYSKVQCWVALDRILRMALKRNLPIDTDRIRRESQKIYEMVMQEGWNGEHFVRTLGGDSLDATSLLFTLMLFISPLDSRMKSTVDGIMKHLLSDTLVYRYLPGRNDTDGLTGSEGTFSMCSFWLVEVLARSGRLQEARFFFEKMLTYGNHLGLYAEEIGPCGEALGNFPQAFTHLALISAAMTLDKQLNAKRSL